MAERVVVFVDYQNAYRAARNAFHDHLTDPHWAGQIHPTALGALITTLSGEPDREFRQVRMYRGLPSSAKDPKGYGAARRQFPPEALPHVAVTARPLRYPWDYPASKPEEKGIDVQIALDFVMMAVRGEYGVGVLTSGDTDLLPALEEVIRLNQPTAEVAAWRPPTGQGRRLRLKASRLYRHWIDHYAYTSIQDNHRLHDTLTDPDMCGLGRMAWCVGCSQRGAHWRATRNVRVSSPHGRSDR